MALDGTLDTLSLPNLIQLHCTQQQNALVRLVRPGCEGVLAFSNGELIHASVGNLTGEDAVYELLAWEDGEFHVSDVSVAFPPANVQTPWSMLVLDALRQIDEQRAAREAAGEAFLKEGKARQEFRRAVIVNASGQVRAEATDGAPEQAAALVALLASRVEALGKTLNLGAFDQLTCARTGEKVYIAKLEDAYIGCWLGERSPLEPLKATVQKLKTRDRYDSPAEPTDPIFR